MKVCVIGAGAAGLCAIKHAINYGLEVIAFEQTTQIGGTWVYTDSTGKDKYGLDIHSSMYKGLHTNLPKEIMHYPDFPFPEQDKSYISAKEVLEYYQSYADTFNLRKYIKFEHHVIRVRPLLDESWEVITRDLVRDKYEISIFDAVLVCNGHYSTPLIPKFEGQSVFEGEVLHSHEYRSAERFTGKNVLIIGSGPSGKDSLVEIQTVANTVTWSHHLAEKPKANFRDNVIQKPDVQRFTKDGAIFVDNSYQQLDVILYCTGYRYTFPFLSVDCGLSVNENCVEPLYKHVVNINKPTLAIIGLPNFICPNQMFDFQVQFSLAFVSGRKKLPSREEMLEDYERDKHQQLIERKFPRKKFHFIGVEYHEKYYNSMAEIVGIPPVKPVIAKMFAKGLCNTLFDCGGFRSDVFKVHDDENYTFIKADE